MTLVRRGQWMQQQTSLLRRGPTSPLVHRWVNGGGGVAAQERANLTFSIHHPQWVLGVEPLSLSGESPASEEQGTKRDAESAESEASCKKIKLDD